MQKDQINTRPEPSLEEIVSWFKGLQDRICEGLEKLDGKAQFEEDRWERSEGGGGQSRVIGPGDLIEKGGVNFSHVHGPMPSKIARRLDLPEGAHFHASGVSIVLHAANPWVPIIHMNVRYFEVPGQRYWFGGGIDVTPIYVKEAQAIRFHQGLKDICDHFDPDYYDRFKEWCDRYFFLKHRNETRGIGGLFFDHLQADESHGKADLFEFVQAVGNYFVPAYAEFAVENRDLPFGKRETEWQALRRSRYVEFNLIHDAGTKFGLETGGRTESILMSMPPMAKWRYNYQPEEGSPEAASQEMLVPRDWLA